MAVARSFVHTFERGHYRPPRPLLLLHGLGGDENDLMPLGRVMAPDAALIAPRGADLTDGSPSFFRRASDGGVDEDHIRRRAHELADFIARMRGKHRLRSPIAVAFCNGADIAAAALLLRPEALDGAILMRGALPLRDPPRVDLSGKLILILSGEMDPIAPPENAARLASILRAAGADVQHEALSARHAMTEQDMNLSAAFIDALRRLSPGDPPRRPAPTDR